VRTCKDFELLVDSVRVRNNCMCLGEFSVTHGEDYLTLLQVSA